jgi:hypothetical protein
MLGLRLERHQSHAHPCAARPNRTRSHSSPRGPEAARCRALAGHAAEYHRVAPPNEGAHPCISLGSTTISRAISCPILPSQGIDLLACRRPEEPPKSRACIFILRSDTSHASSMDSVQLAPAGILSARDGPPNPLRSPSAARSRSAIRAASCGHGGHRCFSDVIGLKTRLGSTNEGSFHCR